MGDELLSKLDEAVKSAKERFDAEKEKEQDLAQKRAELDRQIGLSREEQVRLQGEYRVLERLKAETAAPVSEKPN